MAAEPLQLGEYQFKNWRELNELAHNILFTNYSIGDEVKESHLKLLTELIQKVCTTLQPPHARHSKHVDRDTTTLKIRLGAASKPSRSPCTQHTATADVSS